MNKIFRSIMILAVVAVVFGSASSVFAQSSTPKAVSSDAYFNNSRGGHGGNGQTGVTAPRNMSINLDGLLHDATIAAFADALNLTVDEIETRLTAGETMSEIALSTGMTLDAFVPLMDAIRQDALNQAVADGSLTEEQAVWLASRGNQRNGMSGTTDVRGNGQGGYGTGTCLNN